MNITVERGQLIIRLANKG
ncbi:MULTISPECIES: hypothetical protein [Photorhabdus]